MNTPPKPNDGSPAFPYCKETEKIQGIQFSTGMSLRAYFAGQALIGELASTAGVESAQYIGQACRESGRSPEQQIAYNCVKIADALIAELNK